MDKPPNMINNTWPVCSGLTPGSSLADPSPQGITFHRPKSDFTLNPCALPLGIQIGTALYLWMTPVAQEMFSTQGCPL